jgi:hypothetical protein
MSGSRHPVEPGPDRATGRPAEGRAIIRAAWIGTAAFVVAAVAATVAPDALAVVAAGVSLVLFFLGCGAFVWSFARAVARSRTEEIAVTNLYFLAGDTPAVVRRSLLLALGVQVVVAVVTASIRPFTPLAFGILVPVYGLGLCGLWAAAHGRFPPRREP